MNLWQLLTALTPVTAVFLLLVVLRLPASRAMPLSLLVTGALAYLVWQVPARYIAASVLEGWVIASAIVIIIAGAIFLLNTLRAGGALDVIRGGFFRSRRTGGCRSSSSPGCSAHFWKGPAALGRPRP